MARVVAPLSFGREGGNLFLPWTIGLKAFFAALAASALLSLEHAVVYWQSGDFAVVTVELPAGADTAMINDALEVMQRTIGIEAAEPIPPASVAALVEPWIGDGNLPADLPLPVLIDVAVIPGAQVDWADVTTRLGAAVPEASLDTGKVWVEKLIDLARLAQLVAAVMLLLIAGVGVLSVVFATRAGLAVQRSTIELLHLLGASDSYIARQFQRHALWLGLRGGICGVLPAYGVLYGLSHVGDRIEAPLLPELAIGTTGSAVLILLPVATALIAMFSARQTVLRSLARMP
ncbi:MAG: cell division protein [Alphaproteobacteria bacterium]|nr:cell division protein [Alphaproteobacteria bacterium]